MKIRCTDRVEKEEEVHRVKEKRNMLYAIKRWKAKGVGHILRGNCRLKTFMEGKTEGRIKVMERQGIRRKWTLDWS
jgi:ribosomal protein L35